jgi:hypothetical protein
VRSLWKRLVGHPLGRILAGAAGGAGVMLLFSVAARAAGGT